MRDENGEYLFTCNKCGNHELIVVHDYTMTKYFIRTLYCDCGDSEDNIAAKEKSHVKTAYTNWGELEDDHRWEEDEMEELEIIENEIDSHKVYCQKCFDNASSNDWEFDEESDYDEDSHEHFVRCDGCKREVEFGWSHPPETGGGRIWPSECKDFNPWRCFPNPKYKESWAKKNWIRPNR